MSTSPNPPNVNNTIIETRNLCKNFGGIHAVNDLNLTVKRNTIHALIGPNGAGKTTVFNLLTKFLPPSSGHIFFNDLDITHASPAKLARQGIVRSFQISSTFQSLTVLENVRVALQRKLGTSLHFWRSKSSLYILHEKALELIDWVGLLDKVNIQAGALPYGQKRALEIATTLALDPEMLLLDEPMAGLGQEDIGRISDLIKRISENRTILMVEHNLSVVEDLCDRITVLARGAVLAEGNYASVSNDSKVREAYIGGKAA